jgi:hypothetical protein
MSSRDLRAVSSLALLLDCAPTAIDRPTDEEPPVSEDQGGRGR